MATNNFLPFGGAAGANVLTQADYAALAARTAGFSSGTANSAQLNKVWRQSSIISAAVAQMISDNTGLDVLDDGTTATIVANLKAATSGRMINTQIFATAGTFTYTPTAGTRKVKVRVIGGGGGGGGCGATTASNAAAGAGGSGGGYTESTITSGFSGVSVVVGAGGTAGAAGANNGGNGSGSSFGALLSATGGGGGTGSVAVATVFSLGSDPAGIGTGGSINAQGSGGSPSIITTIQNYQSGVGGGSSFGGGASQRRFSDQGVGRPGVGPGAGGSGAASGGSTTTAALAGGAGAPGIVIVEEYF